MGDHDDLLRMVAERDFCDFPTAWAIQRAGIEHKDPRCSAAQTAAFLCDCGAIDDRWAELRTEVAGTTDRKTT